MPKSYTLALRRWLTHPAGEHRGGGRQRRRPANASDSSEKLEATDLGAAWPELGTGSPKAQSKIRAQRVLRYSGDGTTPGPAKADAVLAQLRDLVSTPDCTWTTQDPSGAERVWTVTPEPDPDVGEGGEQVAALPGDVAPGR